MSRIERVQKIEAFIQQWLSPDNRSLSLAIEKTVDEQHFTFKEVSFQLQALKLATSSDKISTWFQSFASLIDSVQAKQKTVLAIHAGNIPMAGFQDLLAIAISGASYLGKRSRRDPWLIKALSEDLARHDLLDVIGSTTTLPEDLTNVTDLIFSGGPETLQLLEGDLNARGLKRGEVRLLQRSTEFSVAILDKSHSETMRELVEAIALYEGRGCRSVTVVLSEFPLDQIKCELGDYFESFWLTYPKDEERVARMKTNAAYQRAMGRSFAWLDSFLIVEDSTISREPGVVHWIQAEPKRYGSILEKLKERIQSVYVPVSDVTVEGWEERTELLHKAQRPDIDWRPDGVDPLAWLLDLS